VSHARAVGRNFHFPNGPCGAAKDGHRIRYTGFPYKTGSSYHFFYLIPAIGLLGIFCGKRIGGNAEVGGKSPAVFVPYTFSTFTLFFPLIYTMIFTRARVIRPVFRVNEQTAGG